MLRCLIALTGLLMSLASGQAFRQSGEKPPTPAREFRGAWVAVVHNIDWPSRKGLGSGTQQSEAKAILDRMESLNMNAVILQVRPHCDAVYASKREPWSPWLTGTMGKSPGYDPLDFWITEAHKRGIEVHAFHALSDRDWSDLTQEAGRLREFVTSRDPRTYQRYARWWDKLPQAERRTIGQSATA